MAEHLALVAAVNTARTIYLNDPAGGTTAMTADMKKIIIIMACVVVGIFVIGTVIGLSVVTSRPDPCSITMTAEPSPGSNIDLPKDCIPHQ